MYDVRSKFFGLVMEELGSTLSPSERVSLYTAFLSHFGLSSEIQIYALLVTDPSAVRAWIREVLDV